MSEYILTPFPKGAIVFNEGSTRDPDVRLFSGQFLAGCTLSVSSRVLSQSNMDMADLIKMEIRQGIANTIYGDSIREIIKSVALLKCGTHLGVVGYPDENHPLSRLSQLAHEMQHAFDVSD